MGREVWGEEGEGEEEVVDEEAPVEEEAVDEEAPVEEVAVEEEPPVMEEEPVEDGLEDGEEITVENLEGDSTTQRMEDFYRSPDQRAADAQFAVDFLDNWNAPLLRE